MVIPLAWASITAWNVLHLNGEHLESQTEDARREKVLGELGLNVIRFGNDEVVRELSPTLRSGDASRSAVVGKIREMIEN